MDKSIERKPQSPRTLDLSQNPVRTSYKPDASRGSGVIWVLAGLAVIALIACYMLFWRNSEASLSNQVTELKSQVAALQGADSSGSAKVEDTAALAELKQTTADLADKTQNLTNDLNAQLPATAGTPGIQGSTGKTGATGLQGATGAQGVSGVATCPYGNCLSLQAANPGVAETGSINVSGNGQFGSGLTVNTNKFVVDGATGNTTAAGTVTAKSVRVENTTYPLSTEDISILSTHLQYPISPDNYYNRMSLGSNLKWNGTAWELDSGAGASDFTSIQHNNSWGSTTGPSGLAFYAGIKPAGSSTISNSTLNSQYMRFRINELGTTTVVTSSNFTVFPGGAPIGTVTTNATATLTGVGSDFTETFKVGDTITVSGETVRTITAIASNTSLTVDSAFSTSASGLSYARGYVGYALEVKANGNTRIAGELSVAGPVRTAYTFKSASYTLTANDSVVTAFAGGSPLTMTLPTAVGITGRQYTIKRTNSGASAIVVATTSSQTIDGVTTYTLASQYATVIVVSDGANWQIVGKF